MKRWHKSLRRLAHTIACYRFENHTLYCQLWEQQDRSRKREDELKALILAMAERIAAQSELLAKRAESQTNLRQKTGD